MKTKEIKIVLYEEQYRRDIINFIKRIAIEEYGFVKWEDDLENMDFEPYKQDDSRFWIVLDENDKVIGTCGALRENEDIIKFNTFYVDKNNRSTGLGANLYDVFINYAKEKKYKTIILGTFEKLSLAIRFYEKREFQLYKKDGEGRRYYKKDI